MTKQEMRTWLIDRYHEQCMKLPRMQEIPLEAYINANLPHMVRSEYWRQRDLNKKENENV